MITLSELASRWTVPRILMLSLCAALALVLAQEGTAAEPFLEQNGRVVLEAENFSSIQNHGAHRWTTAVQDSGWVGTGAIGTTPDNNLRHDSSFVGVSPEVSYDIVFQRTGTYYVWLRLYAPSSQSNSIHAGLDGHFSASADRIETLQFGAWAWTRSTMNGPIAELRVEEGGEHTFHLWMREDGTRVDRILLTTDSSYRPTGAGPAESPRDGATGNQPPTVSITSPTAGQALTVGQRARVTAETSDVDGSVSLVEFRVGGTVLGRDRSAPFAIDWTPTNTGNFALSAVATDDRGQSATSSVINGRIVTSGGVDPNPPAGGAYIEVGGRVTMEAEEHDASVERGGAAWIPANGLGGMSGGGAIFASPDRGQVLDSNIESSSPSVAYNIRFTQYGTYYVWARAFSPAPSGDTFHVGLDGTVLATSRSMSANLYGSWNWTHSTSAGPIASVNVPSAGVHTLDLWMREDGLLIDKFVLTKDPTWRPTTTGPAPSARDDEEQQNAPPSVDLTAPTGGASYVLGDTINMRANAADADSGIDRVEFLINGIEIGEDRTSPYAFSWRPTSPSSYQVTARAVDRDSSSTLSPAATIHVSEPDEGEDGAFLEENGTVVFEAEHFEELRPSSHHSWNFGQDFAGYSGTGALIAGPDNGTRFDSGFETTSPMAEFRVQFTTPGTYYVWARLFGRFGSSDSIHVGIDGRGVSTADRLDTRGVGGAWVWSRDTMDSSPATIRVDAASTRSINVWVREDGVAIDKLILTRHTSLMPTGNGPAESRRAGAGNPGPGAGANQPPTVTLTQPTAAVEMVPNGHLDIRASASDEDGTVTRVEFWINDILYSRDANPPYQYVWNPQGTGSFQVTARAFDDDGATTTSTAVSVRVSEDGNPEPPEPPEPGESGAFLEASGIVSVETEHFSENVPRNGQQWELESTPSGASASGLMIARPNSDVRFDGAFNTSAPEMRYEVLFTRTGTYYVWVRFHASTTRDDSVHVGLDGNIVTTSDKIQATGTGVWAWSRDTSDSAVATLRVNQAGLHTVNLWVREDGVRVDKLVLAQSSGYRPTGLGPAESARDGVTGNQPPVVSLQGPSNGSVFQVGQSILVDAAASDPDDSIDRVEFYVGSQLVGVDRTAPYRLNLSPPSDGGPVPQSPVVTSLSWASTSSIRRSANGSDGWPITWAADNRLITAFADGRGFLPNVPNKLSLGLARVDGTATSHMGTNFRSTSAERTGDGPFGKKACGLLMVNNILYMLVRNANQNGRELQLAWSLDNGSTWQWSSWRIAELGFGAFIQYGRNYAGARDEYVYMVSNDNSSAYENADQFVLTRVRATHSSLIDRNSWQFFERIGSDGRPVWASYSNRSRRGAVFSDPDRCRRSSISYNAALGRYFWWQQKSDGADSRFSGGFGVFDAPEPWGPWTQVYRTDNWDVGPGERGSFPTKWMSGDGRTLGLAFSGDDSFSVRTATLSLASSPYEVPFQPIRTPGTYAISVTAYDRRGGEAHSASRTINIEGLSVGFDGVLEEQAGRVVIEAESFASNLPRNSHSWQPNTSLAGYSGSAAMKAHPDSDVRYNQGYSSTSPELRYRVRFSQTGTYHVWIRGRTDSTRSDSLHVGIDGAEIASADRIQLNSIGGWTWTQATMDSSNASIQVNSSGEHTINVWMREDGIFLDKVILTRDSSYTPTGTGPAQSPPVGGQAFGQAVAEVEGDADAGADQHGGIVAGAETVVTLADDGSWRLQGSDDARRVVEAKQTRRLLEEVDFGVDITEDADGSLWIADAANRLLRVDSALSGAVETWTDVLPGEHARLVGVEYRPETDSLLLFDGESGRVHEMDASGELLDTSLELDLPDADWNRENTLTLAWQSSQSGELDDGRLWLLDASSCSLASFASDGGILSHEYVSEDLLTDAETCRALTTLDAASFDAARFELAVGVATEHGEPLQRILRLDGDLLLTGHGIEVDSYELSPGSQVIARIGSREAATGFAWLLVEDADGVWLERQVGVEPRPLQSRFRRGDVNADGPIDLRDVQTILEHLFLGSERLSCEDSADVDDDGAVDLADAIALARAIVGSDEMPAQPFPDLGADPSADELDCER